MFDVGAGGVEVCVVGDDLPLSFPGTDHDFNKEAFGSTALVGGEDVADACDVLDDIAEAEPAWCAGVGLVTSHDPCPLFAAHRAGSRVGQEVDHDIIRWDREEVVVRLFEGCSTLFDGGHADGFDGLDAEGFDDRFHGRSVGSGGWLGPIHRVRKTARSWSGPSLFCSIWLKFSGLVFGSVPCVDGGFS